MELQHFLGDPGPSACLLRLTVGRESAHYGPPAYYGPPKKIPPFAPARVNPDYSSKKKYNRIKRCTAAYIFAPANEISGPSAFAALCATPTSPSKGCGSRGQSHSVRSPPDNNEQPKSHSFGRTDGLHLALNVLKYQRVEGATVLERRRRKTTKRKSSPTRSVRHRQSFYRALYFTLINPLT